MQTSAVAKWLCACGDVIQSSGSIPNSQEWLLVSDQDMDAFTGLVRSEDVYAAMSHAFRCGSCDRLHVFWAGIDQEPAVYVREA